MRSLYSEGYFKKRGFQWCQYNEEQEQEFVVISFAPGGLMVVVFK